MDRTDVERFFHSLNRFCWIKSSRSARKGPETLHGSVAGLRSRDLTKRTADFIQPKGPIVFLPLPSGFALTTPPVWPSPKPESVSRLIGAIMTERSCGKIKERRAAPIGDRGNRLFADHGARAPVPSGFRLADARRSRRPCPMPGIARRPSQPRLISPIKKQNWLQSDMARFKS